MPKEMLPLFSIDANNKIMLKPVLQLIFEQLYDAGFREFCFVVGRGKRSVEDHFT
ncbi:MAG: sugar phosphate nucleotidyltransferase, partial [Candidatus Baldrarchaeia archaeon]